jgi:hypothetical protein
MIMHELRCITSISCFFRERTSRKTLLPEQPPHVKNAIISVSSSYSANFTFLALNAFKHPTPGHASETISHRSTAIFLGISSVMISPHFQVCSSLLFETRSFFHTSPYDVTCFMQYRIFQLGVLIHAGSTWVCMMCPGHDLFIIVYVRPS